VGVIFNTLYTNAVTCATIMLTKHSYIFTSIIIIALSLVKNPRNVLKKLHAVLGMMLKAIITTSLERGIIQKGSVCESSRYKSHLTAYQTAGKDK
jgi:hypothetical protein